jgi:hypothetical protein
MPDSAPTTFIRYLLEIRRRRAVERDLMRARATIEANASAMRDSFERRLALLNQVDELNRRVEYLEEREAIRAADEAGRVA